MSLFKVRSFWSTCAEENEFFDQNSIIVTKINSEDDYVISGSQSGILRVFNPHCELSESGVLNDFSPNDLMVEKSFDSPILQVGSGKLISGSTKNQIAVLRPKVLSIYSLVTKIGKTDHGNQSFLQLLYEHKLRKSAYSFVIGPFGRIQNRDFICVQSLDGLLMFFEQESLGFYVALPEFLLPASLAYVPENDTFVTISSSWALVSISYKTLSDSAIESDPIYSKLKVSFDWSYQLGEPAIDILVVNSVGENMETWVTVLGERNLFCFNEKGQLKFMKKFEFCPLCFHVYLLDNALVSAIVSETSSLLIYKNTTLEWSCKLDFLPISINRVFLNNIEGALVLLGEEGRLELCYLGTEPSIFVAPPLSTKMIDFEMAGKELMEMEDQLKKQDIDVPDNNFQKELRISVAVKSILPKCEASEFNIDKAQTDIVCPVMIEIRPQVTFQEIQIAVFVNRPLEVYPRQCFYSNLNEKTTMKCLVFLNKLLNVPTLNLIVNLTVITNLGIPRYLSKEVVLPVKLVSESCSAEKESRHKITLSLNQKPLELEALFPEFKTEDFTANTVGIKMPSGDVVSVLLAKNSDRYRLQSNSLASMSVITEHVVDRLNKQYREDANFKITLSSSLPASEVFEYVKEHFEVKQREQKLQYDLSQLSAQYRLIQKRLITKFKSKEPTSLKNLELLLNDTHADIVRVTEQLQSELENLRVSQVNLTCALFLIDQLIQLLNTDKDILNLTSSILKVEVTDAEGQSWEDVAETNICYLLKNALAKSGKDKQRPSEASAISELKDINKFEKHFLKFLERTSKCTKVDGQKDNNLLFEVTKELSNVQEDEAEDQQLSAPFSDDNIISDTDLSKEVRYGNRISELSITREASTRQSLLTKRKKLNNVEHSIRHDLDQDDLV